MAIKSYAEEFQFTERLLREKKHELCTRELGRLLESALRELLTRLFAELEDTNKRDEIIQAEAKHAKSGESYKKFGLGQLVGLYREARIVDKLCICLGHEMPLLKKMQWDLYTGFRNEATHGDKNSGYMEESTGLMYYAVKVLLYETRLISANEIIASTQGGKPGPEDVLCPDCSHRLEALWSFCPHCGASVARICPSCKADIQPSYRICPICEVPLRGRKATKAMEQYELLFRGAFLDSVISAQERISLDEKRLELGISSEDASKIETKCMPANILQYHQFVRGVLVDGVINDVERRMLDRCKVRLEIDPTVAENIEYDYLQTYGKQ